MQLKTQFIKTIQISQAFLRPNADLCEEQTQKPSPYPAVTYLNHIFKNYSKNDHLKKHYARSVCKMWLARDQFCHAKVKIKNLLNDMWLLTDSGIILTH